MVLQSSLLKHLTRKQRPFINIAKSHLSETQQSLVHESRDSTVPTSVKFPAAIPPFRVTPSSASVSVHLRFCGTGWDRRKFSAGKTNRLRSRHATSKYCTYLKKLTEWAFGESDVHYNPKAWIPAPFKVSSEMRDYRKSEIFLSSD